MILTMFAIVPSIVLLVYIYKKDKKEKEPKRLLLGCFLLGVLSAIPASLIEEIEDAFVVEITRQGSMAYAFIDAFFVAALTEELLKYLFLKKKTWKNKYFDCMFDGIVYSVFVSLGFATIENIIYVFEGGLSTAILRMFTSIPGHTCFSIYMGYFLSKAKLAEAKKDKRAVKKYKKLALWVPVVVHGFYDMFLMVDEEVVGEGIILLSVFIWFVLVIALFVSTFKFVKKASNNDEYIVLLADGEVSISGANELVRWQCECGSDNLGNFCTECGCKRPC